MTWHNRLNFCDDGVYWSMEIEMIKKQIEVDIESIDSI